MRWMGKAKAGTRAQAKQGSEVQARGNHSERRPSRSHTRSAGYALNALALVATLLLLSCENPVNSADSEDSARTVPQAPQTYRVTYDANGATNGEVPADSTSYETAETATVLDNTGELVKDGHRFIGWNTADDATGNGYQAGDSLTIESADVTLYAHWVVLGEYAVTYNANGADSGIVPSAQTKTEGIDLEVAAGTGSLARTGHTFAGWNTADDGSGTAYAEGATYSDDADLVLYAVWEINSYTVSFNSNGGTDVS